MNLLDVNVLLALQWESHPHHAIAKTWYQANSHKGWASCALTQAGFVRISSQSSFESGGATLADVARGLNDFTTRSRHKFLSMDFDFEEVRRACTGRLFGHRQVADAFLLTLAIRHKIRFVSLDGGVAHLLATDLERKRHLVILSSQ